MILMTFGVGIFAVLTDFLATRLLVPQRERTRWRTRFRRAIVREEMAPLWQENAAMRAELADLNDLLKQQGLNDDHAG